MLLCRNIDLRRAGVTRLAPPFTFATESLLIVIPDARQLLFPALRRAPLLVRTPVSSLAAALARVLSRRDDKHLLKEFPPPVVLRIVHRASGEARSIRTTGREQPEHDKHKAHRHQTHRQN